MGVLGIYMRVAHDPPVNPQPNQERLRLAGEAIREAREAKGWTQPELAVALTEALRGGWPAGRAQTVSQPAVSRWELGRNVPEQWKLPVIEEVLDLPAGTLAAILYDRPPVSPDLATVLEARLDQVEAGMLEMLQLLRDLDRRIQGRSQGGDEEG